MQVRETWTIANRCHYSSISHSPGVRNKCQHSWNEMDRPSTNRHQARAAPVRRVGAAYAAPRQHMAPCVFMCVSWHA